MRTLSVITLLLGLITSSVLSEEVNVFSARHYDSDIKLYEKFTKATGIKVNVVSGKDAALQKRIIEEGKDYRNLCHPYVLNFANKGEINIQKGFAEVLDAATGFMLIKRECLLKMKEAYPDLKYKTDQIINNKEFDSENTYLFFDTMKDDDGRYLSEDYAFSRRWQKIGGKIYADIGSKITHFGSYRYSGELWKHFNFPKS